jgi:hypothetical protein
LHNGRPFQFSGGVGIEIIGSSTNNKAGIRNSFAFANLSKYFNANSRLLAASIQNL